MSDRWDAARQLRFGPPGGAIDYSALEAGVTFMAVPCLMLFLFLQRSYVRGFMSGAVRG
jgi:multiple sugar transport system permease protein